MILVRRAEDKLSVDKIDSFEAFQLKGGDYTVIANISGKVFSYFPKGNEAIDLVDCGRRIVSVMETRVRWYGAAPK